MAMQSIPAEKIAEWLGRAIDRKDAAHARALVALALDEEGEHAAIEAIRRRLAEIVSLGVDDALLVRLHRRAGGTATWRALGQRLRATGRIAAR